MQRRRVSSSDTESVLVVAVAPVGAVCGPVGPPAPELTVPWSAERTGGQVPMTEGREVMAIGDAEIRDNGMFNRGVSLGNMLAGLCAATFPILGMLMLTMVQNASDKATMNERVEQYHRQEVGETDRIKKDAEAQAARTEAMREQMTVFHIQQMEKQTETNTSVQNLYNILKTDAPRKGR